MKKRSASVKTGEQVLIDHIRELRTRLVVCAIVLVIGGVVGYIFYAPILEWLRSPLGTDLYYNSPAGSFNFILKVSSMIGILAAVPFVIFQLIMFVQPVFREKLSAIRLTWYTTASVLLAVVGALFAFYIILPGALRFFAGFQVAGLSALIDANNYLNFVINAIVTFLIVFQIPLIMVIIDRIKPIPPKKLLAAEKYVIVGGLLVSLLVPFALDITTSLLIASPIIILYNLSVGMIIIRHFMASRRRVEFPVIAPLTKEQIELDEQLVAEFFAKRSQKVPELTHREIADALEVPEEMLDFSPIKSVANTSQAASPTPVVEQVSVQPTVPRNIGKPLHMKPLPGEVKIAQLRAEAQALRDKQIAERVARYNTASLKIINDIR